MKRKSKVLIVPIIVLLSTTIHYVLAVPALNLFNPGIFFWFIGIAIIAWLYAGHTYNNDYSRTKFWAGDTILAVILTLIPLLLLLVGFFRSAIFTAYERADLAQVELAEWSESIPEAHPDKLQTVDKDTSAAKAGRVMAELGSDYVSQYAVDNTHSTYQLVNGQPVRALPLKWAGAYKSLKNGFKGIPAYITVNAYTGETTLHKLEKPIMISPSGFWQYDLVRTIRRIDRTTILASRFNFEIDEAGTPYWVISGLQAESPFFCSGVKKVFTVNAQTGQVNVYQIDELPEWLDRPIPQNILLKQLSWSKKYHSGWWNSWVGQRGVLKLTASFDNTGYNYIPIDGELYLYTGITSAVDDGTDESNLGFAFVNTKTGITKEVAMPVAEEFSAMASAEGTVQEKGYLASYPIIIKIHNRPVYFTSLKDKAGLTKAFAFIDAEDYTKVSIGDTVSVAYDNYCGHSSLVRQPAEDEKIAAVTETRTISIQATTTIVVAGTSYLYAYDGQDCYAFNLANWPKLAFTQLAEQITVDCYLEGNAFIVTKIR